MRSKGISSQQASKSSSSSSSSLNDDVDHVGCFANTNYSYRKLPQQLLLNLSVLKLDGSLFDVCVGNNATVSELKQAIEEVFVSFSKEISWSHVWGHFCLCYDSQMLINDKTCIRSFGIKDGDQLQFIRHMSIQYPPLKKRTKNQMVDCKQYSLLSPGSNAHEEKEETGSDDIDKNENQEDSFKYYPDENQEEVSIPESKLANFVKGWLSHSRLWNVSRKGSEGSSHPSLLRRWA